MTFIDRHPEYLNDDKKKILSALSLDNWFDEMVEGATFLGKSVGGDNGVHKDFLDRLKLVESDLNSKGIKIKSIDCAHKGAGKHPHAWGIAADINYEGCPYILGDVDAGAEANGNCAKALTNSLLLTRGQVRLVDTRDFLHSLRGKLVGFHSVPTLVERDATEIFRDLNALNSVLQEYLALDANPSKIRVHLDDCKIKGVVEALTNPQTHVLEDLDTATTRWQSQIRTDLDNLQGFKNEGGKDKFTPSNFRKGDSKANNKNVRDPRKGFLDLSEDLVVALRDKAGLGWGAVDFGPGVCGDIMHFDLRRLKGSRGRKILSKTRAYLPPEFQPAP